MQSIFLSYSFRPEDRNRIRDLLDDLDHLLASHGIRSVRGKYLGGEPVWQEIEKRIQAADGLIALLTRRDQLASGNYTTSPYVLQEIGRARTVGRRTVALVETGVTDDQLGAEAGNERIFLDQSNPLPCFIELSEIIGVWKAQAGRTVKIQILPEDLARQVGQSNGQFRCRYRLASDGKFSDWKDIEPIPETGGTFLYLRGVNDQHAIQVEINKEQRRWFAPAQSQWIGIRLEEPK
jgi:hypothetical protein